MTVNTSEASRRSVGPPRWVAASLKVKEGRDPLGLQTTTQDRLMPKLLPGILELSRRARYLSFHAYLLERYRSLRMPPDSSSLSMFIKAREWEFGLGVLKCPHGCNSSPVGASTLRHIANEKMDAYPRGQSVESAFGGYGLYYRSPLAELGIVARSGTMLGEKATPIDVLRDTPRARHLAVAFADAVAATEYVRKWMLTTDPIPGEVLVEYAEVACLCQLRVRPAERDAVHDALFGQDELVREAGQDNDPPNVFELGHRDDEDPAEANIYPQEPAVDDANLPADAAVVQRRRSVAHFLSLIDETPQVVEDEGIYRETLWSASSFQSNAHEVVAGQWAGLIAKDVWQDALCSIWSEFCHAGFEATSREGRGLAWEHVHDIALSLTAGPPGLARDEPTVSLAQRISTGAVMLPGLEDPVHAAALEDLRATTEHLDSAASGLIVILELYRRASARADPGWLSATGVRSAWQQSLSWVMRDIAAHLATNPSVGETLWWILQSYVLSVHERIAYSKLPENTFRFRWEEGRVRFYGNGLGRFTLAAIRHEPLTRITWDLALWDYDTSDASSPQAALTPRGRRFIQESLQ